jgi:hypothetical protein
MIVFVILCLTVLALLAITMVASVAVFIVGVSILPIFGMFGVAVYEGIQMLSERESPERRVGARTRPVTGGLRRALPHH